MKILTALFKKIKKLPTRYKIVGLITIVVLGFFLFSGNKKAAPLQFALAKKQDIQQEIAGSGTLSGKNSTSLHFKTNGKLAYINVNAGDEIFQGQVIAGLDTEELNINLREAQNTLRDKRAIVDKIHDDLKDVGVSETYSQRQTRTTAEVAQDNAYEGFLAAQKAMRDSVLYSPIPGVVTQALNVVGQSVTTSDLIAQIINNSEIYFDTDIDEADIGKIKLGLGAKITLDSYHDTIYKGSVAQIFPQTKTTTSGATVITVRIKLDTTPPNFVNGLSGEASIIINSVKDAITIPLEALRGDNAVFVQSEKGLKSFKVTPGISSDTDVEIIKGLQEKERVLLNPPAIGIQFNQNRSPLTGILRAIGVGGRPGGAVRGR